MQEKQPLLTREVKRLLIFNPAFALKDQSMSLVMAMQFGDRTCILSDSMISDVNAAGHDVIPGQLKTIVLSNEVSVSYSGSDNKSISKIREIRADLSKRVYFDEILVSLSEFTADEGGGTGFIVSSHMAIPKLYKIADGEIHYGLDMYWIGNEEAAGRVLDEFGGNKVITDELPSGMTQEEWKLREAFKNAVFGKDLTQTGGLVFDCVGTPGGYRYNNHGMASAGEGVSLDIKYDNGARFAHEKPAGEGRSLSIVSPNERSLPVTGAFFERDSLGFIYSPLDPGFDFAEDEVIAKPEAIYPVTLKGFVNEVEKYASRLETYLGG